ncbi:MAG TPA: hypothetical protein VFR64_19815 [Methylomirabilota bacterium]|nr:hypothetical protein [Methylomirabilota bacterium]
MFTEQGGDRNSAGDFGGSKARQTKLDPRQGELCKLWEPSGQEGVQLPLSEAHEARLLWPVTGSGQDLGELLSGERLVAGEDGRQLCFGEDSRGEPAY